MDTETVFVGTLLACGPRPREAWTVKEYRDWMFLTDHVLSTALQEQMPFDRLNIWERKARWIKVKEQYYQWLTDKEVEHGDTTA